MSSLSLVPDAFVCQTDFVHAVRNSQKSTLHTKVLVKILEENEVPLRRGVLSVQKDSSWLRSNV